MTSQPSFVQSLDRAMAILEFLSGSVDGMRLGELAAAAALPPSTCHRLLSTMERRRFVQFDPRSSSWFVGRGAFRVGAAFLRRRALLAPALPVMRALRDATRETVNVGVPDDGFIVVVAQAESREVVRAINVVGGRAPMSSCGLGKAILGTYGDGPLEEHVIRHGLPRLTAHTLVDEAVLRDDLATTRLRGYAIDRDEHVVGLHCVAAAIVGATGDAVAAISVSGLAARMDDASIVKAAASVTAAAAALSGEAAGLFPASGLQP